MDIRTGGQGKPLEILQKQAFRWAGVEGKRRDGLQRAASCSQNRRQQNQFGYKEASVNRPVVYLQNELEASKDQIPHALGKRQLPISRVRA